MVITAQGRTDPNQPTGISIINCTITAALYLVPVIISQFKGYLGRPWMLYSRTVYMKTLLDVYIDSAGWLEMKGYDPLVLSTLYYGEYENYGPGCSTQGRVRWPGFKVITDIDEAEQFSVDDFIGGQTWLSGIKVPFAGGLDFKGDSKENGDQIIGCIIHRDP